MALSSLRLQMSKIGSFSFGFIGGFLGSHWEDLIAHLRTQMMLFPLSGLSFLSTWSLLLFDPAVSPLLVVNAFYVTGTQMLAISWAECESSAPSSRPSYLYELNLLYLLFSPCLLWNLHLTHWQDTSKRLKLVCFLWHSLDPWKTHISLLYWTADMLPSLHFPTSFLALEFFWQKAGRNLYWLQSSTGYVVGSP